jgi:hypothetical protein
VYGYDTHSWRNSTEKRQIDKERQELTRKYEAGEIVFREQQILTCRCRSFKFAHDPIRHRELASEFDWRTPEEREDVVYQEYGIR